MDSDSVIVQFYDFSPEGLLDCSSTGMGINENKKLAESFYHSRNQDHPNYECDYKHSRDDDYERNAGAAELYIKDGDKYVLYVHQRKEKKQYHTISLRNKYFKEYSRKEGGDRSTYAHSERMLMRDIMDDLLSSSDSSEDLVRPSDCPSTTPVEEISEKRRAYDILKYLTANASKYREYLTKKGLIVKMWSERPPCQDSNEVGGCCDDFIRAILPRGSHCGFIIKDYSKTDYNRVEKAIEAFKNFEVAFKASATAQSSGNAAC